jgi:hypothetical protein
MGGGIVVGKEESRRIFRPVDDVVAMLLVGNDLDTVGIGDNDLLDGDHLNLLGLAAFMTLVSLRRLIVYHNRTGGTRGKLSTGPVYICR